MIHTSRQLKALVRNKSHGDNAKATTLIRNFVMDQWKTYQRKYDYAAYYNWNDIIRNIEQLFEKIV